MKKWILMLAVAACMLAVCALADEKVTITGFTDHGDATGTLTWDYPAGGEVCIAMMPMTDSNQPELIDFTSGDSYRIGSMAPGVNYAVFVIPASDSQAGDTAIAGVDEPGAFDDFRFTIQDVHLMHFVPSGSNYTYNYADELSNDRIYELLDEKQFLVRIDFRHKTMTEDVELPVLTVVTAPNGHIATGYTTVEMEKDTYGFWMTMVYMNDALSAMYDKEGAIPTGAYSVKVYLGGGYVGESSFTIID